MSFYVTFKSQKLFKWYVSDMVAFRVVLERQKKAIQTFLKWKATAELFRAGKNANFSFPSECKFSHPFWCQSATRCAGGCMVERAHWDERM